MSSYNVLFFDFSFPLIPFSPPNTYTNIALRWVLSFNPLKWSISILCLKELVQIHIPRDWNAAQFLLFPLGWPSFEPPILKLLFSTLLTHFNLAAFSISIFFLLFVFLFSSPFFYLQIQIYFINLLSCEFIHPFIIFTNLKLVIYNKLCFRYQSTLRIR